MVNSPGMQERIVAGDMKRLIYSFAGFANEGGLEDQPYALRMAIDLMLDMPVAASVFWGNDYTQFYNDAFAQLLGDYHPAALGSAAVGHLQLWAQISDLLQAGTPKKVEFFRWPIAVDGPENEILCSLSFIPVKDELGVVAGTMLTVVKAQQTIVANEDKFRVLMMNSPVAMVVFKEPGHIIEIANEAMLKVWKRKLTEVMDKPLLSILPEMANQKFPALLDKVYATGIPYEESEAVVMREFDGIAHKHYVNFEYTPLRNAAGVIEGVVASVTDVTDKVKVIRQIEDAEERMRLASEGTGLATWELNLRTRELISSPRLSMIFGESPERSLTHPETRERIHKDDIHEVVEKAFEKALKTGFYNYEARVVWTDNSIHWIRTMGKVLFDSEGVPERLLGTMIDISEQIAAKITLQEQEKKFRQLVKGLPFAVYMCDAHGYLEYYNDAALALWGRQPMLGQDQWCGTHKTFDLKGNELTHDQSHTARSFRENKPMKGEAFVERPDGERRHVLSNPQPIHDAAGNLTGVMNAVIDITDTKRAEQALKESELRFRTVANTAPVMIWMSGLDKLCYFLNKGWLQFTGRTIEDEIGDGWTKGIHPDDAGRCADIFTDSFDNRKEFYMEYRLLRHDGEYRWISDTGVPRYNATGAFEGYIGCCVDIQDQKLSADRLEKLVAERTLNLKNANIALERSNEELEQFAFVTSHDLQEPLRKINTFAHMLHDKNETVLNEEGKKYIDKITLSAQRMSRLINDLLNFSRLNRSDEKFVAVDLNELMDNIRNDFELMIAQKSATLNYTSLPTIMAIPLQMNQLLYNLISNALKFSAASVAPVINVSYRAVAASEIVQHASLKPTLPYCEIVVSDNGIGFKQEYAQKIFEIFQRLNDKGAYEGTGIGLALCNKIVTNHDGLIFAQSEEGWGTAFHIYLPVSH